MSLDRHLDRAPPAGGPRPWQVVTAATGEAVPALGLEPHDRPLIVLSGDRLLVLRLDARGGSGEFLVVDPFEGIPKKLSMPAGAPERPGHAAIFRHIPGGAVVLGIGDGGAGGHLLCDPATETLGAWTPSPASGDGGHPVACIDGETAIFLSAQHTLVRVRWGSAEREVLFPR